MSNTEAPENSRSVMRCLRCRGLKLERSGKEPHRLICKDCGQNFFAVMQLVPVEPLKRPLLLEEEASAVGGEGAK